MAAADDVTKKVERLAGVAISSAFQTDLGGTQISTGSQELRSVTYGSNLIPEGYSQQISFDTFFRIFEATATSIHSRTFNWLD